MKNLYLAFILMMAVFAGNVNAQCTIDTAAFTAGVIVYPSSLSVTPGIGYSGSAAILVPDSLDASAYDTLLPPNTYYVYLDSIYIDSVSGVPAGIASVITPSGVWLHPGQYGCIQFSGTTSAASGSFPIAAFGGACVHGNILGYALDSCQAGQLPTPAFFNLSINVLPSPPCIPDSAAQPRPGISPAYYNLPCLVVGQPFDQTLQVRCPTYFDTIVNLGITSYPLTVTVDSMELDSVSGLPAGITWSKYPNRLAGGQIGCLTLSGTTTAPTGYYTLGWYGTAWVTEPYGLGNKTVTGNLNRYAYVDYYLSVINAGDSCIPYNPYASGINEINSTLNTALTVSPNPNTGIFTVKLNAGSRVNGQMQIVDVTGRSVYEQDVDLIGLENMNIDLSKCARGIYTLLLKTANGNAAKRISIE